MDIDLNKYYQKMIIDLRFNAIICPLCFNDIPYSITKDMKDYTCGDHFRLMTVMSDIRLCIKDKYDIDFVCKNEVILEVKVIQTIKSKTWTEPYKYNLLDLIDQKYEFKELIEVLNKKLDKLITFE